MSSSYTFSNQTFPNQPVEGIAQLIPWIREAGQIALSYFNRVEAHLKADSTFLTAADIEIQRFLEEKIRTAFPEHAFIGEENTQQVAPELGVQLAEPLPEPHQTISAQPSRLSDGYAPSNRVQNMECSRYIWVIDPLDGTTAFALGLPGWGISVGLLIDGKPALGYFYMPLQDDLTYTLGDGQLYWNNEILTNTICETWLPKRFIAVNATAHSDYDINIRGTRSLGSIGSNLIYTVRGAAACAFAPKAKLWDLVACAAIMEAAGGTIIYIDGTSIEYLSLLDGSNTEQPIIAGHPNILAMLPQQIKRRRRE